MILKNFKLKNLVFKHKNRLLIYIIVQTLFFFSCKSSKNSMQSKENSTLSEREKIAVMEEFMEGARQKIAGNFDKSANHFQKILKMDPRNAAAMYELATILEHQRKDALALSFIKQAISIEPKNEWYRLLYATLYAKNGNFYESAKVYKELSDDFPMKIEYMYELANALLYQNKYKDAIEVYDDIEKKIGVTEDISLQKQKIWLRIGNNEKAVAELKKLIASSPNEPRYYGMLAELYQSLKKTDLAMETFNELKKIDPKNPYVHLSLSNYYRDAGNKEKSFEELQIAFANADLSIDTKVSILLAFYAAINSDSSAKKESFKLCKILVETHPEEAKAYSVYGDFLIADKKISEAREQYLKAISLDKSKFLLWNQLMLIENELRDFEAMHTESKEAIELFPNQPSFYFFNGIAAIQKKLNDEAVKILEAGKDLVFDNNQLLEQFYSTLGDAYNSLKNYPQSDSAYEKALKINPDNIYVLNNYSYYLSLRKENLERAEKMSKRSLDFEPNSPSFLDTYAWILYQMEKYEDAKKWLEKALASGAENNGTILEHFGDVLFKLNNREDALKYWLRAKEAGGGSDLLDKKIAEKNLYE